MTPIKKATAEAPASVLANPHGAALAVGARVVVYTVPDVASATGEIIAEFDPNRTGYPVGIKLDSYHPKAHSCEGLCEKGFGWWAVPEQIALA